jgi:hypothetical protein
MIAGNNRQRGLLKRIGAIFVISSFFEMSRWAVKERILRESSKTKMESLFKTG